MKYEKKKILKKKIFWKKKKNKFNKTCEKINNK